MSDYNGPSYHATVRILEPSGYMDLRPGMEVEAIVYPELEHVQIERLSRGKDARWWSIRKDAVQELKRHGAAALVAGLGATNVVMDEIAASAQQPPQGDVILVKSGPFKGRTYRRNALGQLERVTVKRR